MTPADPSQLPFPLRLMADQTKAACDINEKHRAYLIERIAQLQAWADSRHAEAEVATKAGRDGPDATTARLECERFNAQAQLLRQRVTQLMQEMHGAVPGSLQQVAERKPWQRPQWWQQLEIVYQGIEKLCERVKLHADAVGSECQQEVTLALVAAQRALSSKPEDIRSASTEILSVLRLVAEKLAPVPWHLVDVPPENGAQLVMMVKHLCQEMPEEPAPSAEIQRADCLRRFDVLLEAMQAHPEACRVEAARQHVIDENMGLAVSILSGVAPPDPLRYQTNRLVQLLIQ